MPPEGRSFVENFNFSAEWRGSECLESLTGGSERPLFLPWEVLWWKKERSSSLSGNSSREPNKKKTSLMLKMRYLIYPYMSRLEERKTGLDAHVPPQQQCTDGSFFDRAVVFTRPANQAETREAQQRAAAPPAKGLNARGNDTISERLSETCVYSAFLRARKTQPPLFAHARRSTYTPNPTSTLSERPRTTSVMNTHPHTCCADPKMRISANISFRHNHHHHHSTPFTSQTQPSVL